MNANATDTHNDFIHVVDGALSAQQCNALIARFDASSEVARGRTGSGVDLSRKDSFDLGISGLPAWSDATQLLVEALTPHLAAYVERYRMLVMGALAPTLQHPTSGAPVGLSLDNFDAVGRPYIGALLRTLYRPGAINLQKYLQGSGGYHHWHSEIYPQNASCESLHRVLLWQFYLNDVAEGGQTEFLYQQRSIAPKQGRLIIAPAGFTHTHKGHVPTSGDKYVATSWILFQRAEQLYGGT